MMPSVFRCDLCSAIFKNRRWVHYSDGSDGFCPGTLEISEIELDELVLASITRRKTRSKKDRAKLVAKRKQIMAPKVVEPCQECEALGDVCARCRHKKLKRDWARVKRARLRSERQNEATRIGGLFGPFPT
jgi:NMD protein affecting ribosome stability and mRNA decay